MPTGGRPSTTGPGSNMHWGVATALLEQSGDEGLFELDEAWLPRVAPQLRPRLLVLGNLFRDQLDRYGELERLADEWAELVARLDGSCEFALNADDPLIADLGRDKELRRRPGVTYFGIEDESQALPELQHAHDAKYCRRCGAPYVYDRAFVGHLGPLHLPELRRRPAIAGCRRHEDRAARDLGLERPCRRPRRASWTSSSPSPASTTSTTRSRRSPRRCGQACRWTVCARASSRCERFSGASRRSRSPASRCRSC